MAFQEQATTEQGTEETQSVIELGQADNIPPVAYYSAANGNFARRPIRLSHYNLSSYSNQFETVRRLRTCPETIDLVLTTQDGGIEPVHTYYLALKAPNFWAQIAHQLDRVKYSPSGPSLDMYHALRTDENLVHYVPRIMVPDIDARMLSIVIDTMYAGTVKLAYELSWQLLALAAKFKLDFLAATCLTFLEGTLNAKNCVHILQAGLRFGHYKLSRTAYKYMLHNFIEIGKHPEMIGQLSLHQFRTVLTDNHLDIGNELYAYRAVSSWIEYAPAERIVHFWPLFALVRWQLIHSTILTVEVIRHFILVNAKLGNILADKKAFEKCKFPPDQFNPRVPRHVVFAYGGYENGLPSSSLKIFDIRANMWFSMEFSVSMPLVYHSMVAIGHKLYIMGGSDGLNLSNNVRAFNCLTCRFRERKSMSEAKCFMAAVKYQNNIVVVGGNNGKERLRTVELYDPVKNQWRPLSPMNSARSDAAAAVHQDKIYVAGGVESFGLSSVEFYSFQSHSWTVVSFMNLPRRGFILLPYANTLYAIGGCTDVNEYTCLRSVERINPTDNQWQFAGHLNKARSAFVACTLEDKIFVFGGYDGFSTCKSIESFHHATNRWEKLPGCVLPTELSSAALDVVTDLPNAMYYTYYGQCALTAVTDTAGCCNVGPRLPVPVDPTRTARRIGHLLLRRSAQVRKESGHKSASEQRSLIGGYHLPLLTHNRKQ